LSFIVILTMSFELPNKVLNFIIKNCVLLNFLTNKSNKKITNEIYFYNPIIGN